MTAAAEVHENPFSLPLRKRHAEILKELDEIQTRSEDTGRMSDDDMGQVRTLAREARRLALEIAEHEADDQRSADVAALAVHLDGDGRDDRAESTVPPLMPRPERLDQMRQAGGFSAGMNFTTTESAGQTRAAVTIGTSLGVPSVPPGGRPAPEPRRLAVAAGLSTTSVQGMPNVVFPVFGDADAAGVVAEGAVKPEYDDISNDGVTPQKIAIWTDITLESQLTYPDFERRLRQKLAQLVAKREDQLLLTTLLAAGIPTQAASADPMAEQLLSAVGTVTSNFAAPNLVVVNPADLGSIFGAGLGGAVPGELTTFDPQIWGARVYATSAITAGTAIVGNFPGGASFLVGMPPTYKVDPFTQMKANVITVLLEEAVNLLVDDPSAFLSVDLVV